MLVVWGRGTPYVLVHLDYTVTSHFRKPKGKGKRKLRELAGPPGTRVS